MTITRSRTRLGGTRYNKVMHQLRRFWRSTFWLYKLSCNRISSMEQQCCQATSLLVRVPKGVVCVRVVWKLVSTPARFPAIPPCIMYWPPWSSAAFLQINFMSMIIAWALDTRSGRCWCINALVPRIQQLPLHAAREWTESKYNPAQMCMIWIRVGRFNPPPQV